MKRGLKGGISIDADYGNFENWSNGDLSKIEHHFRK
jgi:hypothetical protein